MKAEEVIEEVAKLCKSFHAKEIILYGSRARGTARERSDIDIAVTGVDDFDRLVESIEALPTLYSVDIVNMDTCKNELAHDYDCEIVKTHCHTIVEKYIDLFYAFENVVKQLEVFRNN